MWFDLTIFWLDFVVFVDCGAFSPYLIYGYRWGHIIIRSSSVDQSPETLNDLKKRQLKRSSLIFSFSIFNEFRTFKIIMSLVLRVHWKHLTCAFLFFCEQAHNICFVFIIMEGLHRNKVCLSSFRFKCCMDLVYVTPCLSLFPFLNFIIINNI